MIATYNTTVLRPLFGDRLTVGQQVLVLFIGVRIPIPEQLKKSQCGIFLIASGDSDPKKFESRVNPCYNEKHMKTFLYIRGNPATGKITVARVLEQKLGWKLFWFHDLKNAVYNIVKEHRIPRLMDEITVPVVKYILEKGENIIYVRPSPDKETIENIHHAVKQYPEYTFVVIRLEAEYQTMLSRALERHDPYRIPSKDTLDEYLGQTTVANIDGEYIIKTDNTTPEEIAKKIEEILI